MAENRLVTIEVKGLRETMKRLGNIGPQTKSTLDRLVKWGTQRAKREVLIQSTTRVGVRSNRFRSSIRAQVRGSVGRVGSSAIYSRTIEFGTKGLPGGVMRPRRSRFLAIPLEAAKTAAGVARSPRDYTDTFVRRSTEGKLLIWGRRTSTSEITPLFTLAKTAKIPPKRVFQTAHKIVEPIIVTRAERVLRRSLAKGFPG